jgi:hypothetical protein
VRRRITITIWDDLPIPAKVRPFPVMKHPLHEMLKQLEIGQALDWPRDLNEQDPNKLRAIMQRHQKTTGKKFTMRTIWPKPWSGDKRPIRRIWRTA